MAYALRLLRSSRPAKPAPSIVIVAGSFATTSILITKAIGVGLAVAIALDASIIRILLVPATMRLVGSINWWLPSFLERSLPKIGEG